MTGSVAYLNGAPVMCRSSTQKTLLTTKAELNVAVMGVQDALFMKNILKSLWLKVKLSILASIDNSGAVDIDNNWSVGGRTRHVEVKQNFLSKLKKAGIIEFQWVSTVSNDPGIFTKNWQDQNTDCVGMINTTALCKTERVMSMGGSQKSQSAHD